MRLSKFVGGGSRADNVRIGAEMKFLLRNKKGFTLVEVIVVLIILAILAAMLVPAMTGWIDKSREKKCHSEMGMIRRDYLAQAADTGYGRLRAIDRGELLKAAVLNILGRDAAGSDSSYTGSCGNTCTVSYGSVDSASDARIANITCSEHGSLETGITGDAFSQIL